MKTVNNVVATVLLELLVLAAPHLGHAGLNQWTGSGPFATGSGNRVISSIAISPDGTINAGTESGTVYSYTEFIISAPTANTGAASGISTNGATLNGSTKANNADASVTFEYGLTAAYGSNITSVPSLVTGNTTTMVSAAVTGLLPGTTYHFRVVATNSQGTSNGSDSSFTTAALPVNGTCGASNGQTLVSAPTTSLCVSGTESSVSGSGPWSWTCAGLNGGSTANCSALKDTVPPVLSVSTVANGSITNNASLNVAGTVMDNIGLQSLVISGVTVTVNNDNTFSYLVTLSTGSNTITATATDTAGNQATDTRIIILDQAAPALAITTPPDNSVTNQVVSTVTGTVDETSTVTVKLNSGNSQAASMISNSFSLSLNLVSGINTVDVTATDLAGNTSSGKRTVTYDAVAPSIAITNPAHDIAVSNPAITVSGTVTDSLTPAVATITVDGVVTALPLSSGTFSTNVTFTTEGMHVITVSATDQTGNSSSVHRNINYVKYGDLDGDGDVDAADALKALRIAAGLQSPTETEMAHGDVAPLVNGVPQPDGKIDIGDVVVILRRAVGLVSW